MYVCVCVRACVVCVYMCMYILCVRASVWSVMCVCVFVKMCVVYVHVCTNKHMYSVHVHLFAIA